MSAARAPVRPKVSLPRPLTNAVHQHACAHLNYRDAARAFGDLAGELEHDCMSLALCLYAADPATFAPETAEVMDRWRPRVEALLRGESA